MLQRAHPRRTAGLKSACALLLALILLPSLLTFALAGEQPARTVRVGYFYNGDFMYRTDDGAYAGYDIEYYRMLAGYAGWKLEFVGYDALQDALDALEAGEIDVMSGLSVTQERQSRFLISALKMCTAHIAVQTRADDDRFAAGDIPAMADLTCGILKGSNVVTLYKTWCQSQGLTPHVVEYDTLQLRNEALLRGEVDAIAGGSTLEGAQKIAEFPSLDLYFMFNRTTGPALKAELDRAMGILALENPTYTSELFRKYFPSSRNTAPSFSAAEKAYIAAHPVLRVAVLGDDAPFSFEENGAVAGILPEYYGHLSSVIGAEFRCVPYPSKEAAFEAVRTGQAELAGKAEYDVSSAYDSGLLLTVPYLQMNLVQITRAGTSEVKTAAVPACNEAYVSAAFAEADPSVQLSVFPNSASCFAALRRGGTDSVVCTQPAAAWLMNRSRTSDYVVLAFGSGACGVAAAPAAGEDGNTLRSILSKTIAVDGSYIQQLITNDTLEDSADLTGLLDRLPVSLIAALGTVAAVLLLVAVAALTVLLRRRSAERQLAHRQAEVAADAEANRAKHAFFGAVSHDMRTPLNGILGFADLALGSGDPAQIRDYLGKIRASGAILNGLVNDTLVMSRLENGKYSLHPAPCEMKALLGDVLAPVRELSREKGVVFSDDTAALDGRTVLADRLSLQKVLLNLLTNAVKFTPPGGTVTFSCRPDPGPDGPDTVFTVANSGVGVSEEFLPHIFEPYAQESAGESTGSGIGLSSARSIVEAMGGTITVQSEKGRGSVFTVRVRFAEPPAADPAPAAPAARSLRGCRVLVCEDNALNLEILRSILERQGAEVTGCPDGRAGTEAFRKSAPGWYRFVLLDLRMPVMDGRETARAIRAMDRPDAAAVPIFAVSAEAYPENVAECLAAGMNGHIAKPIDPEELLRTLVRYLPE